MAARKKPRRRKAAADSRGLAPRQTREEAPPPEFAALEARIAEAGGELIGHYRDPLGRAWLALAALPLAAVAPTPFQRDLSDAHVKRLTDVIERVGVFLDPVVAVAAPAGSEAPFWVPNGNHRLNALRKLGARTVTVLVSADPAIAYRILALNTEKAHTTKEKALEAVRMARGLAEIDGSRRETEFALELEDGSLVTLGLAYEERPRGIGEKSCVSSTTDSKRSVRQERSEGVRPHTVDQIRRYGGRAGIRDLELLKSALGTPQASYGGEYLHATAFEMAAAYLFHIARNHPFVDGNQRVGLIAALVFLGLKASTSLRTRAISSISWSGPRRARSARPRWRFS